jgi:hypothetical protein
MKQIIRFLKNHCSVVFLICLLSFQSCDTLEEDIVSTGDAQTIKASFSDVFVLAENSGVMDLTTGITSNKPFLVSISQNPSNGDLQLLSKNIYAYTPDQAFTQGNDKVVINIRSLDGEVSVNETINVIVTAEKSELPCDYYAINEEVTIQSPGDTVVIDVLANDITCENKVVDPASLKVLYNTSNGTASVVNGKIRFIHDPLMPVFGSIFYTVNLENCIQCTRPAYISLKEPTIENCTETVLNADRLTISTTGPVTFNNEYTFTRIRVLNNDFFCGSDADAIKALSITDNPQFGTAEVDETGSYIKYWMPLNTVIDLGDSIAYKVCIGGNCLEQTVYLKVRFNPTCAIYPAADNFDVGQTGEENSFLLDVIANDELCQLSDYTSIMITQQPSSGTVTIEGGKVRYTNSAGTINDQLKYSLCTTNGYCSNPVVVTIVK